MNLNVEFKFWSWTLNLNFELKFLIFNSNFAFQIQILNLNFEFFSDFRSFQVRMRSDRHFRRAVSMEHFLRQRKISRHHSEVVHLVLYSLRLINRIKCTYREHLLGFVLSSRCRCLAVCTLNFLNFIFIFQFYLFYFK